MTSLEPEKECEISFVVIGRNESANLRRCADSIRQFESTGISFESIYVDSASSDDSIAVAGTEFDLVVRLAANPNLNAGAGRSVGTELACGKWIMYLDGDMALRDEAWPILRNLCASANTLAGACGQTLNIFPDGRTSTMALPRNAPGRPCMAFGGAVILSRTAVLRAGNWSPRLFAYEETELHTRLMRLGVEITWHPCPVVNHHTDVFGSLTRVRGMLFPWGSHLGRKFYGAGQMLRDVFRAGTFRQYARLRPEAATILLALVIATAISPVSLWAAAAVFLLLWGTTAALYGMRSALQYTLWLPQVFFGLAYYPRNFIPAVDLKIRGGRRQDISTSIAP